MYKNARANQYQITLFVFNNYLILLSVQLITEIINFYLSSA